MKVATPQEPGLAYLEALGLIVPHDEILKESEGSVPLDFTAISSRVLGQQHSYWAVRHSHALVELAKVAEQAVRAKRNLKIEEAQFRARHMDEYKAKYNLDDAMEEAPRIKKLRDRLMELDAQHIMVQAIVDSYEGFRNAASREIARRSSEITSRD